MRRLSFQLDFLNEKDRDAVLAYYEKKIASAATITEEEAMIKSFGDPIQIAAAIRQTVSKKTSDSADMPTNASLEDAQDQPEDPSPTSAPETKPEIEDATTENDFKADSLDNNETDTEDIDVIFSKPATPEKAPEIVHSLENKEVKTLFGEKVTIEPSETPIEEIVLEPIDEENGLTAEEIEAAKLETLEKAKSYNTETFGVPPEIAERDESSDDGSEEELVKGEVVKEEVVFQEAENKPLLELEEEVSSDDALSYDRDNTKSDPLLKKTYTGLFRRPFASSSLSEGSMRAILIILTVLISPVLATAFAVIGAVYAFCSLFVILVSVVLFILMVAMIIGSVIELVYGFSLLFDSVSIALIEIGIGTALFAIVTALAALIYEFIFGVMPRLLKSLTRFTVRMIKTIVAYIYGGTV